MDNNELIEKVLQLEREAEERKRLDEKLQIASRLDDIERMTANLDGKDMTPDAPRAGVFAELQGIMPRRDEIKSSLLPFQIEFGKPTADVTADGYSVTLQPCDVDGNSYASADTIIVFVPCHGESIELGLYGWIAAVAEIPEDPGPPIVPAVPAVPGTVLSFIRFAPWLNAPHVEGVIIGIGDPTASESEPSGIIVMWGGAIVDIPTGWTLCDGGDDSNSVATPDLRGRFIAGSFEDTGVAAPGGAAGDLGEAGDYDAPGDTGGKAKHGPTENEHAKYQALKTTAAGEPFVYMPATVASTPVDTDTDNRPPYYTLAFIRKD